MNINKCTSSYISNYDSSNAFHIKYYMNTLYDTLVRLIVYSIFTVLFMLFSNMFNHLQYLNNFYTI